MADVTIYHNARCSKSRETLALLAEHGVTPRVVYYLETPPTATELAELLHKLGLGARQLLRRGEAAYAELGLADEALSEAELLAAMVAHPVLIERPIVVCGDRAAIGRPPTNILAILPTPPPA